MKKINTIHIMLITSSLFGCDSQKLNDNSNQLSYANATLDNNNQNSQKNHPTSSNYSTRDPSTPCEPINETCVLDTDGKYKTPKQYSQQ